METVTGPGFSRKSNFVEKLVSSKLFWLVMCSFLFAYPLIKSVQRVLPTDLPVMSQVPDFRFTDENGNSYGTNELKGKVYVANFMFTSCTTSCPLLLKQVQIVQHRMRGLIDKAAIVSFTVDPDTDTSKVLYEKARDVMANPVVWRFLSASVEDTKKLLIEGFKVPMGDKETANNIMDVAHSNKLVLVDQDGFIRGYYEANDDGINKMMIDTGFLVNKKKKS